MFEVNSLRDEKPVGSIAPPRAMPPVEPVVNKRYWAQLETDKPMFAMDVIVLRADGDFVDLYDVMGRGVYRYPRADVTFYDWTPDALAR